MREKLRELGYRVLYHKAKQFILKIEGYYLYFSEDYTTVFYCFFRNGRKNTTEKSTYCCGIGIYHL